MRTHFLVHCGVLATLGAFGIAVLLIDTIRVSTLDLIPFSLGVFASGFGLWKTSRYASNIRAGCEITVTTAEAKVFPYLLYFVSAVLGAIRVV